MYAPNFPELGADQEQVQYVELINNGASEQKLDGWSLVFGETDYELPNGVVLKPGEYAIIPRDSDFFEEKRYTLNCVRP